MAFNGNVIPWHWRKKNLPVLREEGWPVYALESGEINRVFDDFFRGFPALLPLEQGLATFQPRLDVTETETELKISVELPGINEKDIDLTMSNDSLTIKGEKNEKKEDRTHGHYRVERRYGSFERTIPFPCEIDADKVDATFKDGVLTVNLPKSARAQNAQKKVSIKKADDA